MPALDLDSARRVFAAAPFVADVGIEPVAVGEGWCEARLTLVPRHYQHTGVVHAGVLTTLADHLCGAAAYTLAPAGSHIVTADLHVRLLRGAKGQALVCRAEVVKPGRQLSFAEAVVFCENGERRDEVARLSATLSLVYPT